MASVTGDTDPVAAFAQRMASAATALGELSDANRAAGQLVIAHADPPRHTGAMAAGQTVRVAEHGADLVSTVDYWTFVHWGAPGAGVRARPWFAVAVSHSTDAVLDVYAAHAQSVLDTVK